MKGSTAGAGFNAFDVSVRGLLELPHTAYQCRGMAAQWQAIAAPPPEGMPCAGLGHAAFPRPPASHSVRQATGTTHLVVEVLANLVGPAIH